MRRTIQNNGKAPGNWLALGYDGEPQMVDTSTGVFYESLRKRREP